MIFTPSDDAEGNRRYHAGPLSFPAVGTILRATAGSRWGLEQWKADLGEELAEQIRDESAERGKQLEADIDAFLFGGIMLPGTTWCSSVSDYVAALVGDADELTRQVVVVHDLDRYAGTLDLRCRRRSTGRKLIVDWKSKSGRDRKTGAVKVPTRSKIYDHLCQVAAYCDAEAWMTGERPDGEVVIALPDRPALVFPVLDADYARWRDRVAQYYLRKQP